MEKLIQLLKNHPEIGQALAVLVESGILTDSDIRKHFKIGEYEN